MNALDTLSQTVFGWICHQNPEFLLQKEGMWVWLCPRCMGLQMGFLLTLTATFLLWAKMGFHLSRKAVIFSSIGLYLLLADWLSGQVGLWAPTHISRLLTGLAGGTAFALLAFFYWKKPRVSASQTPPLPGLAILYLLPLVPTLLWVGYSSWKALSVTLLLILFINIVIISSLTVRKFWFHP